MYTKILKDGPVPDSMARATRGTGIPVKDFVSSFIEGLEAALIDKGYATCPQCESHATMELHAVATKGTKGEGGAKIAGIGGSLEASKADTQTQKVTVFVKKSTVLDKEEEKARIAIAKVEQSSAYALTFKRAAAGRASE